MTEPVVDLLDTEWHAMADLGLGLSEAQWKTPVALEGWDVQDCVSHIMGTELSLMGEPTPEVDLAAFPWVQRPFQQLVEPWVAARRDRLGAEVLAEFTEVIERRLAELRAMPEEEMAKPGWSPIGEVPYRDFMRVRVFDSWMHEQDMRRALGIDGHLTGPVVDACRTNFAGALGFVVGKRAAAADGTTVRIVCTGGPGWVFGVVVDGRAKVVDETEVPAEPTVTVTVPFTTFVALGGGRWHEAEADAAGGIELTGDSDLGRRILAGMAFTP